jgi:hypothetical protein
MVIGGAQSEGEKYFCRRGWVAKFLEVVVEANNFGHIVNPFVQYFVIREFINGGQL